MSNKFETQPLKPELLKNLVELEFHSMTPIQEKGLPIVLEGRDVIAQAKTGSGKTAVFGLTILNSLDITTLDVQSLILCPTRELAEQVAKEIRTLARLMSNVRVLTICGGVAQMHQEKSLDHGAHIIVGTPGRVLKMLKKEFINPKLIQTFVLDEADRMLDMGFNEDIMAIKSYVPAKRQTMLFSATYPDQIQKLSKKLQFESIEIKIDVDHEEGSIKQTFFELESHKDKNQAVLRILAQHRPNRFLVFCKTKQITDDVAKFLNKSGIAAAGIHGDLEQNERTAVLTKFSNKSLSALVATDVAARGLDIEELPAVFNYDLPSDPEVYIHRIGRTGRAGLIGQAFSLFISKTKYKLEAIEALTHDKANIQRIEDLPAAEDYDFAPTMRTMYIGGGKKDKLRPGDILGALVGEAKIDSDAVGDITILSIISYVAIKNDSIEQAVSKLSNGKIKNRKFKVGIA
jgi:ATP-independent RNA helicase DbpA